MDFQFDLKKFDPRFWTAMLVLLGFSNAGDFLSWARKVIFGDRPAYIDQAIQKEARARITADSALLARIDSSDARNLASNKRVEKGQERVETLLLKVPQVLRYADEEAKVDSLRRKDDRRRRLLFDREARGINSPRDRELR